MEICMEKLVAQAFNLKAIRRFCAITPMELSINSCNYAKPRAPTVNDPAVK